MSQQAGRRVAFIELLAATAGLCMMLSFSMPSRWKAPPNRATVERRTPAPKPRSSPRVLPAPFCNLAEGRGTIPSFLAGRFS